MTTTFLGFRRADGRIGTRNGIGVFVAGNCAATAARMIADTFTARRLAAFPNVDGVVPFTHELGCGMEKSGEPMDLLRRTIGGSVRNPNLAGAVVLALGCERNNIYAMLEQEGLVAGPLLHTVVLQEVGGTAKAIEAGVAAIEAMLPLADACQREEVPVSGLVVGLQNTQTEGPDVAASMLGAAVDLLVKAGGTALVSATAAVAPALQARSATPEVASAVGERVVWWQGYTAGRDLKQPASEAAPAHAGSTPLAGVIGYAHALPADTRGLVLMDSPAYEAISATGQVASGANLVCVVSRGGSAFSAPAVPTVRVASNAEDFALMEDDLDIDITAVTEGRETLEAAGQRLFEQWLRFASGDRTCGEELGIGENEFVPWPIGVLA